MKKLPLKFEVVIRFGVLFLALPVVSCISPGQEGTAARAGSPASPGRSAPSGHPGGVSVDVDPGARIVRPGAPGEPTRVLAAEELPKRVNLPHTAADVEFMQGMIPHHAQALDMGALVEERTESPDIRLLARRIEISQKDEIGLMGRWLEERGEEVPGAHAHHMMGDHLMPGMLTDADMAELAAARDDEFDRLFLEHMIRHHEGAIIMVRALFASPGAGQETDIYNFASHVDADQQIEIRRMGQMLAAHR